jgi:hypothetical protein
VTWAFCSWGYTKNALAGWIACGLTVLEVVCFAMGR